MSKFEAWKLSRVRAFGKGATYLRLTPFFGFQIQLFGKLLSYSTVHGWSQKGWISKQRKKRG